MLKQMSQYVVRKDSLTNFRVSTLLGEGAQAKVFQVQKIRKQSGK